MPNDYHLAIATALPTEDDSDGKKSSAPNPNLPGPFPGAAHPSEGDGLRQREEAVEQGWGLGGGGGNYRTHGAISTVANPTPLAAARRRVPHPPTSDGPRRVGEERGHGGRSF